MLQALGGLLDRYGLPIAILVVLGWLLLTRRLVLGSEVTYVEERRREERQGRLEAESALRSQTDAMRELTVGLTDLTATVAAAGIVKETTRARR